MGGLASPVSADPPSPGWGAYKEGTVAVLGRFPDLLAQGFVVEVSPGVFGPGNYDRNKFSVLMIENWDEIQNKRFVDHIVIARAAVLLASPINADNLWNPRAGKQSIYWTELLQLRSGEYPFGTGTVQLSGGIKGAVSSAARGVGSLYTIGGGVISGAIACQKQLEELGIHLDNTTLGLLHIANCLARSWSSSPTATWSSTGRTAR